MSLFELFSLFFYIGLFTIGGGQVAITLMYQELVTSGIIDAELFYNMLAVSESTPGPIGINMATYLGYEMHGLWGGILTTAGTVAPSIIIIMLIARYFGAIQKKSSVQTLFTVLRPTATGLVWVAACNVLLISVIVLPMSGDFSWQEILNIPRIIAFLVMLVLLLKTKIPIIAYIVAGAVFGVVVL